MGRRKMTNRRFTFTLATFAFFTCSGGLAWGQEHGSHSHTAANLHFSHPLVTESPSPDTKLRFDYFFAKEPGEDDEAGADRHTFRLEGEYAFTSWLSFEVDVPYTFLEPDEGQSTDRLDNTEVGLKYANFTFSEYGLLLGGGIEFGLPTGNEEKGIGSNHVLEVEPYLDVGYKRDRLEIVGFTSFGLPQNENCQDEADLELGWNVSVLYHATPRIQTLLEFDGEHVFGGEEDGLDVVNVTPGIKVQPLDDPNLQVGVGVSLPLTDEKEFYARLILSAFYHF
jgi:hypothetical protein